MVEVSEPEPEAEGSGWLRRPFISLSHPQFRFFWLSNFIIAVGLMVQFTARGWLIVELTDRAFLLGAVEAVFGLSFALSSIPMGVLTDRTNRRNLLLLGDTAALLSVLAIGLLVWTDMIEIWHVVVASGLGGVLFALRFPAGQAMTARLVPAKHLMNAIALNTASRSLPSVAGPAVGGVLIGLVGIAAAYFLTTGAFVVALLMLMLGVPAAFGSIERSGATSVLGDLREAFEYLMSHRELLLLTGAILIPFVLGQSYVLLLPLFVEQELGGGPATFGALSASLGAGSLLGAMAVATFGKEGAIGRLMLAGVLGAGVCAIIYGVSHWLALTAAALLLAGAAESALFSGFETLLLMRLPDEIRGRVMGLMFTLVAMYPISALAAGAIADQIGLRTVAVIEGFVILALAAVAWNVVLGHVDERTEAQ